MKSNTEFNNYKLKFDRLYLSLFGGKVAGKTIFTKPVTFSSGDSSNDLVIKDKTSIFNPEDLPESSNTPTDDDVIIAKENSIWYQMAFSKIWDYISAKVTTNVPSHVGQVIYSTALSSEAAVKAVYGSNTRWTQIKDRFLLAAGNTYVAGATNGSADAIVPYHTHTQNSHYHSVDNWATSTDGEHSHSVPYRGATNQNGYLSYQGSGPVEMYTTLGGGAHAHVIPAHNTNGTTATNQYAGTSGNTVGANMPPYKVVYVWERIA